MLPLSVFKSHQFSAANAVTFVVYGALSGALFLVPVELQLVARYSALESGLALLPITAIMLVFSPRSGRLATRIGPRLQMSLGPIVAGAGLVLLTQATHSGSYLTMVLPAMLVFGAGLAITVAPLTSTAMSAAPAEHAGVAFGRQQRCRPRAAGLIAVTVLPLLAGPHRRRRFAASSFRGGFPCRAHHRRLHLRRRRPSRRGHDPEPIGAVGANGREAPGRRLSRLL